MGTVCCWDPELFDLANDVAESRDVADDHPEVVAQLMAELEDHEAGLTAPLWR